MHSSDTVVMRSHACFTARLYSGAIALLLQCIVTLAAAL
jgi:hypothetical protein